MSPGSIILLNGPSSAGKTTTARAIQRLSHKPVQLIALDQFRDGMCGRYRGMNSAAGEPGARGLNVVPNGVVTELQFGDIGRQTLKGMRRAAAAFATTGIDVVIDDLLVEEDFLHDYLNVFRGFAVTFVGVHCDLSTLNSRERSRPYRFPGTAASHSDRVHDGCCYDVEIDTVISRPRASARVVVAAVAEPSSPTAFERMRAVIGDR